MSSSQSPLVLNWSRITQCADDVGLSLIGTTSSSPLDERDQVALARWQQQGHAGDLTYLLRPPALMTDARSLLPEGLSIIFALAPYESRPSGPPPAGFGRVARYAWGRDYHRVLKKRLQQFAALCVADSTIRWRAFTDAVPLLERPYAARAQLGFIGKHTLLIRPGMGSFFVIGGVIFGAPILDAPELSRNGSCGSCFRCASDCPTGAIVSPYVLSAPRCISYLTIEKRGAFTIEERRMLGSWVFGCDICQEVCPHNHRVIKFPQRPFDGLEESGKTGPFLSLAEVMGIRTEDQFLARFKGTPLMRARREGLIRNALCVSVNQGAVSLGAEILTLLQTDSSPLIRQHALWAADSLALCPRKRLETIVAMDPSPLVVDEWRTRAP